MIKEVNINKDACIGCGICTFTAPNYFEVGSDGYSQFKQNNKLPINDAETEALLIRVAQSCPAKAISLVDENGNFIFPKK